MPAAEVRVAVTIRADDHALWSDALRPVYYQFTITAPFDIFGRLVSA